LIFDPETLRVPYKGIAEIIGGRPDVPDGCTFDLEADKISECYPQRQNYNVSGVDGSSWLHFAAAHTLPGELNALWI
jgi:hypothetical protein